MRTDKSQTGFTFVQVLAVGAIVFAVVAFTGLPSLAKVVRRQDDDPQHESLQNVRQLGLASLMYSGDYDDQMPLLINGSYRNMQDVKDGVNTKFKEERADAWPLLIMPYIKTRRLFVDPTRGDQEGIWSAPAIAATDKAYASDAKNTFRNQDQFPMYGLNYLFLSPAVIPKDKVGRANAMDFMRGESHATTEIDDPSGTVWFTASKHYGDQKRGFFVVNAPGMWQNIPNKKNYVIFSGETPCSGDWCREANTSSPGNLQETNSAYFNNQQRTPVVFIDGHCKLMTDVALTAGTTYLTAAANDGARPNSNLGGCVIVDKSRYLWNSNDNFFEK
jgi:hypothetical protein